MEGNIMLRERASGVSVNTSSSFPLSDRTGIPVLLWGPLMAPKNLFAVSNQAYPLLTDHPTILVLDFEESLGDYFFISTYASIHLTNLPIR